MQSAIKQGTRGSSPYEHFSQHFQEGQSQLQLHNYQAAVSEFNQAILAKPDSGEAYLLRGNACYEMWITEQNQSYLQPCVESYQQALSLNVSNPGEAYLGLGRVCISAGEHTIAVNALTMACDRLPGSIEPLLLRAGENFQIGRFDDAFSDYNAAIALKANDARPYLGRGWAYFCAGQNDKALADFNAAVAHGPNNPVAYVRRAAFYAATEAFEKAVGDYTQVLRLQPDDADSLLNRSLVYARQKQFEMAIVDLDKAVQLSPKNARFLLIRAYCNGEAMHVTQSLADYEEVIKLESKNPLVYFARATTNIDRFGEFPRGIEDLERAISIKPDFTAAYNKLAEVYQNDAKDALAALTRGRADLCSKQYQKAIKEFDKAIAVDSTLAAPYFERGRAIYAYANGEEWRKEFKQFKPTLQRLGNGDWLYKLTPDSKGTVVPNSNVSNAQELLSRDFRTSIFNRAKADFTEAIRFDPKNAQAYVLRGLSNLVDADAAAHDFDQALAIDPKLAIAHFGWGMLLMESRNGGKAQDAVEQFTRAIQLDPKIIEAYEYRAKLYAHTLGEYASAIGDYNQLIAMAPSSQAYLERGFCHRRLKQNNEAIDDVSEAIRLDPNKPDSFCERGGLYFAVGRKSEAFADLHRAVALRPNDPRYAKILRENEEEERPHTHKWTMGEKLLVGGVAFVGAAVALRMLSGDSGSFADTSHANWAYWRFYMLYVRR